MSLPTISSGDLKSASSGAGERPSKLPRAGSANPSTFTEISSSSSKTITLSGPILRWSSPAELVASGLIRKVAKHGLRILGDGKLERALHVSAHYFTESARDKIVKAGGSAEVIVP